EAGDKNDSRLGIDGIHLLHQLLLGKTYALTIASFASVAGHGARESYSAAVGGAEPVMRHIRAACGVVTDHHNRYIGSTRRVDSSVSNLIGRVVDLDAWARFILDSLKRRDSVRRCAAVPIPVDGVGQWPDHGDRIDGFLLERQEGLFIL